MPYETSVTKSKDSNKKDIAHSLVSLTGASFISSIRLHWHNTSK